MEKFFACEEKYLVSYLEKRSKIDDLKINKEAGFFNDLEESVENMKNIVSFDGDTATINIKGVLVNRDPDIWDALFDMPVCSYRSIREAAMQAVDMNVDKVIVQYDTPGGSVSGVEKTREELKAMAGLIKTESVNMGMCCSAGMWLASSTGNLISNDRTTEAGSIGVVMTAYDDKEMLSNFGITRHVITNKQSTDKIPDISKKEGRDIYQAELDQIYDVFANNVVEGFKMEREKIDALKGRVLIGDNAVEYGLMKNSSKKENEKNPVSNQEQFTAQKPGDAGNNKINMGVKMTLAEIFESNPEAKIEFDKKLDEAKKSGSKEVVEKIEAVKSFIKSDGYVSAIKDMAFDVIEGKTDLAAFKTTVAIADQLAEKKKSEEAQKEQSDDTPAQEEQTLSKDGQVKSESDYQAMVARMKGGN